ncbi:MAG: endonuclease/exonuclease/phosphatase family protein [Planctomycetes bacterium]|nr:endonuclease/exonuclease/phosphatase family protein [Planctomycetota bacterium]
MAFTLASWNVLAQAYVRPDRYPGCEPAALDPELRAGKVARHIGALDADVVCLQEAEAPIVKAQGIGTFEFASKSGGKPDGCAIGIRGSVRADRFETVKYSDGSGHIALVAFLTTRIGKVAVATTHLKWDPPDTPAAKRFALRETDDLLAFLRRSAAGIPWIICGDFNVTSDDEVIARFIKAGLKDAYATIPQAATCIANGRARRIDFILYTADLMATPRPLPPLADDSILPSTAMPSDHLPIAAAFERLR